MNTLEHVKVVPIPMALDEKGVIIDANFRPSELDDFMKRPANITDTARTFNRAEPPSIEFLISSLANDPTVEIFRAMGEAYFHTGDARDLDSTVYAFEEVVRMNPDNGRAHFALGTALRRRYESVYRKSGDQQSAVNHWGRALDIDPNHYIYRRRLQQYGPRLDKPYNFYFWVAEARKAIRERGEEPVLLSAEPMGSEISAPEKDATKVVLAKRKNPDKRDRINHDKKSLVNIETLVTPSRVQPGHRVRSRVTFRLNETIHPFWNNEADDLTMWIDLPKGLTLVEGSLDFENPKTPETQELRQLEFEVQLDNSFEAGAHEIPAYALYYVCEHEGGVCYFLRKNFTLSFTVDAAAAPLK